MSTHNNYRDNRRIDPVAPVDPVAPLNLEHPVPPVDPVDPQPENHGGSTKVLAAIDRWLMKLNLPLCIGLLGILVFIGTLWADLPALNGLGAGCGFAGLVILAVYYGMKLAAKMKARPAASRYRRRSTTGPSEVSPTD